MLTWAEGHKRTHQDEQGRLTSDLKYVFLGLFLFFFFFGGIFFFFFFLPMSADAGGLDEGAVYPPRSSGNTPRRRKVGSEGPTPAGGGPIDIESP